MLIELRELQERLLTEQNARDQAEKETVKLRTELDEMKNQMKAETSDPRDREYNEEGVFSREKIGSVTKFDPVVAKLGLRILLRTPITAECVPPTLNVLQEVLGLWPSAEIPSARYFQELRAGLGEITKEQLRKFIFEDPESYFTLFMDGSPDSKKGRKVILIRALQLSLFFDRAWRKNLLRSSSMG